MKGLIGKALGGRWARNALALHFPELERFAPLPFQDPPPSRRPLVLAPHADDESIGCGGTLRRYADQGASVQVAVITDGSLGNREIRALRDGPEREQAMADLVALRRREALAATQVLGVQGLHFLDAIDGQLNPDDAALAQRLDDLLHQLRPDLVLLPFVADRHRDHWNTNRLFINVCQRPGLRWLRAVPLCAYEVWAPLHANLLVDIGAQLEAKRQALAAYGSQLASLDYPAAVLGLNRYRAACGLRNGHAEAFHLASFDAYQRLYRKLSL